MLCQQFRCEIVSVNDVVVGAELASSPRILGRHLEWLEVEQEQR